MSDSLPLPVAGTVAARSPPLRALPWITGIALCLFVALATLSLSAWTSETPGDSAASGPAGSAGSAESPPAHTAGARSANTRFGVVEVVRQIGSAGALPPEYEFTVRLRDGSARVSRVNAATASAWVVGDRIMLVGGR